MLDNKKRKNIIIILLSVIAVMLIANWLINHNIEKTDNATIEAKTISISSKISGYISKVNITDNLLVKKGDILLELDPKDYQLRLDSANAKLKEAEVYFENSKTNATRQIAIGKAAGSQKDIDNAMFIQASAQAKLDNAKAQLAIAQKDLDDTKIIAPSDGVVTLKKIEAGDFITQGQQLLILVAPERWVVANFKEVQIARMHKGQKVTIKVDAYPKLKINAHIDSIQSGTGSRFSAFPAENATGNFVKVVQRVPVKILIDSPIPDNVILGPGLSVIPTVYLDN